MIKLFIVLSLFFTLITGCQSDPNSYSGITHIVINYDQDGQIEDFVVYDGKERSGVAWELSNTEGGAVLKIGHQEAKAFDGQATRSAIEAELKAAGITPTPAMMAIIDNIITGM